MVLTSYHPVLRTRDLFKLQFARFTDENTIQTPDKISFCSASLPPFDWGGVRVAPFGQKLCEE